MMASCFVVMGYHEEYYLGGGLALACFATHVEAEKFISKYMKKIENKQYEERWWASNFNPPDGFKFDYTQQVFVHDYDGVPFIRFDVVKIEEIPFGPT
jgi:hypothetical protein